MATTRKTPTKKEIEELKVLDGDFVDYTALSWCNAKPKKRRKLNFNVVWFTVGAMFGMFLTGGMATWIFLLS